MTQLSDESRHVLERCNFLCEAMEEACLQSPLGYSYTKQCQLSKNKTTIIQSLLGLIDAQAEALERVTEVVEFAYMIAPEQPKEISRAKQVLAHTTEMLKGLAK